VAKAIHERAILGERMAAAGFGKTTTQHLVVAIEKYHPNIDIAALAQWFEQVAKGAVAEAAGSDVDVNRQRPFFSIHAFHVTREQ
jgi:hypothetical protein